MKKFFFSFAAARFFLLIFVISSFSLFGQSIQSSYLQNPETMIGYVDSCARFWISSYDSVNGGFYTNVDRDGTPNFGWGTNKNMLTQSRNAYGFTRAFMLTGDTLFLRYAKYALDFLSANARDTINGGWFAEIDQYGNPFNTTNMKSAFDQHYALLGPCAYYEAVRDSDVYRMITEEYQMLENTMWDSRPDYFGYYDIGAYDWSSVGGKSFNATVDAVTTHLLSLYLLTGEQTYRDRLTEISANILDYLVASMQDQAIGFAEKYTANWDINNGETMTLMGHVLKAAWCLGRYYHYQSEPGYQTASEKLIYDVYNNGYDHTYGGPYKDYNRITGEMLLWGSQDSAKAWWQMEQAVTAGLVWYYHTGNTDFLTMADESLDFFMNHFVDPIYGEVYENRTRYGGQIWGLHKGTGFKAAYHSIELGFYTYLYGNLLLHQRPAVLYYAFAPRQSDTLISLNPLAVRDSLLSISSVTLNGVPYPYFSGAARELTLKAGEGGLFAVTYEHQEITGTEENTLPSEFTLRRNYPNPFNPVTTIEYTLPQDADIVLSIYNLLGSKVAVLEDGMKPAGTHRTEFNAADLASGIYIYQLKVGKYSAQKKMLLLK